MSLNTQQRCFQPRVLRSWPTLLLSHSLSVKRFRGRHITDQGTEHLPWRVRLPLSCRGQHYEQTPSNLQGCPHEQHPDWRQQNSVHSINTETKLLPASLVLVYLVLSLFKYQQSQILEPSVNWETHRHSAETVCWFLHLWVFPFSQIPENPMKGLRKSFARKIGKLTSVWSFSMKFQTDKNISRKLIDDRARNGLQLVECSPT